MTIEAIDPYTGEILSRHEAWDAGRVDAAIARAAAAFGPWAARPVAERAAIVKRAGAILRKRKEELASLMTAEMGKLIADGRAEVEKCAYGCDYYAEHGPTFLEDEAVSFDEAESLVAYQPLGPVLAIMPWNFPLWQVFRFAAPALVAGNVGLLKHASNVPGCALAIEDVFREAGAPEGVFTTLMIGSKQVEPVIADSRVRAVTLTGSEPAGRAVGAASGKHLKKSVLELGGSDAFVVLEDADVEQAAAMAVKARMINGGQSCIAAKRFIVTAAIADRFVAAMKAGMVALRPGDPRDPATTVQPLARPDLRDELHEQVQDSIKAGAVAVTGCKPLDRQGVFYAPSILDRVAPGQRAYEEELFGPVAIVIRAEDEADAIRIANDSRFGLGGSVWTGDAARGERVARQLECGSAFVNAIVKSDPHLPFGGVKDSGYGRELSRMGMLEFVNAKTLYVGR